MTAPSIPARTGQRIQALDFTKGALVLIMVLYHWLNYFVSPDGGFYRYLRFLTPSFIFLSGFVISHVYFAKYGVADLQVTRRLALRGLKILAVFVVVNVLRALVTDGHGAWSAADLFSIFVTGNITGEGGAKAAAFVILVPIGYLLILAAAIVAVAGRWRYAFHAVFAVCLAASLWLSLQGRGVGNLELVTIGLFGLLVGYLPSDNINSIPRAAGPLAAVFLLYQALITWRTVTYPLQFIGVPLNLAIIYSLGSMPGNGPARRQTVLLGKYSLFGYVAQIVVLQVLQRVLRGGPAPAVLVISFVASFALTILAVDVTEYLRKRVAAVNTLYSAVFA